MSDRADQIARILDDRRPLAQRLTAIESQFQSLAAALRDLETDRDRLAERTDDPRLLAALKALDFATGYQQLDAEVLAARKLRTRCQRETLNIGVVGRARQGKSRLLQSLSGLSAREIPDGDRQHCTGVRSTIRHHSHAETYGEVWFHTEQSFLDEVIAPYFQKLQLGAKPPSLDAFADRPLPPLSDRLSGYAEPGATYQRLRSHRTHLERFRHLLGTPSPKRISQGEIREYVAQDLPNGDRIFNYLAVREVRITCQFPNREVGKIALVDMPGLGDTGLGDEERLVQTLGQDVDAVLFVRMPKASGDYWADVDVRLYDIARDSLPELSLDRWSFLVLNRTAAGSKHGDNGANCEDLLASLGDHNIAVAKAAIANCADPNDADAVLGTILDYLGDRLPELDAEYAGSSWERWRQLFAEIEAVLSSAEGVLEAATGRGNWFGLFEQLFEQLWDDLTTGLEGLLAQLREQRDDRDADFKEQVDRALQACREDSGIPTEADIETRRDRLGGYPLAYYEFLNEIRARLSRHFLLLDAGLQRGLERVKSQVAQVLVDAGLGGLSESQDGEFLGAIAALISDELVPGEASKLKFGVRTLAEFQLSYRGLIQHRIRKHLDDLMPDATTLQLSAAPTAKEVQQCLQALHAEAVYKCGSALDDLLSEPSQAAFAIVEEFLDRVLRSQGVKTEWRIFLEELRDRVWQDEFERLGERSRDRRDWLDLVARARNYMDIDFSAQIPIPSRNKLPG